VIHLDFSDFEPVVDDVRPWLPGIFDDEIRRTTAAVLGELTERGHIFVEEVEMAPGETFYELISPHDCSTVIGVRSLIVGGERLLPGQYRAHSYGQIELQVPPAEAVKAVVVLKTLEAACGFPTALLQRWMSVVCDGVRARLLLQPGKQWSNPEMGLMFREAFERGVYQANADSRNEFSVTRQGRSGFCRSVWS
jgi:hypothetical protein